MGTRYVFRQLSAANSSAWSTSRIKSSIPSTPTLILTSVRSTWGSLIARHSHKLSAPPRDVACRKIFVFEQKILACCSVVKYIAKHGGYPPDNWFLTKSSLCNDAWTTLRITFLLQTRCSTSLVALEDCCGTRRCKVRSDRRSNHDSKVPGPLPIYTLSANNCHQYVAFKGITCSWAFESFTTTTPASKSLCPPRYFVAECII